MLCRLSSQRLLDAGQLFRHDNASCIFYPLSLYVTVIKHIESYSPRDSRRFVCPYKRKEAKAPPGFVISASAEVLRTYYAN